MCSLQKNAKLVCSPQSLLKVLRMCCAKPSASIAPNPMSKAAVCTQPHQAYQTAVPSRQKTVPHNRTDEPYQVKGGVKGGAPFCTNTKFSIGTVRLNGPPLTPPLTWYGSSVRLCGTVGALRAVRLVRLVRYRWYGCVLVATLGIRSTSGKDSWTGVEGGGFPPEPVMLSIRRAWYSELGINCIFDTNGPSILCDFSLARLVGLVWLPQPVFLAKKSSPDEWLDWPSFPNKVPSSHLRQQTLSRTWAAERKVVLEQQFATHRVIIQTPARSRYTNSHKLV